MFLPPSSPPEGNQGDDDEIGQHSTCHTRHGSPECSTGFRLGRGIFRTGATFVGGAPGLLYCQQLWVSASELQLLPRFCRPGPLLEQGPGWGSSPTHRSLPVLLRTSHSSARFRPERSVCKFRFAIYESPGLRFGGAGAFASGRETWSWKPPAVSPLRLAKLPGAMPQLPR